MSDFDFKFLLKVVVYAGVCIYVLVYRRKKDEKTVEEEDIKIPWYLNLIYYFFILFFLVSFGITIFFKF